MSVLLRLGTLVLLSFTLLMPAARAGDLLSKLTSDDEFLRVDEAFQLSAVMLDDTVLLRSDDIRNFLK